jgi:hypothetical protein
MCAPCGPSTFASELNAETCSPWTTCSPGEFLSALGDPTRDASCSVCPEGTFSLSSDAAECSLWTPCPLWQTPVILGTTQSDQECALVYPVRINLAYKQGALGYEMEEPLVNSDGAYVFFHYLLDDLFPGDTNARHDGFRVDFATRETVLVTVGNEGQQGEEGSHITGVSPDGNFAAFYGTSSNLVSDDANGDFDVFLRDIGQGTTTLISANSVGVPGNGGSVLSTRSGISADGRYVVFHSSATDLVDGDENGHVDVFLRDTLTSTTTLVSVSSEGAQGNARSHGAVISGDGRYVGFTSYATNLVALDENGKEDVFVHDVLTGSTVRVSVASDGTEGDESAGGVVLNYDGSVVAFSSWSTNLVPDDTNSELDAFVHYLVSGLTARVSLSSTAAQGNGGSSIASISADGARILFGSAATNLGTPGASTGHGSFFIRNLLLGETSQVTLGYDGSAPNEASPEAALSADGSVVVVTSWASNLVQVDANEKGDLLYYRLTPPSE